MSKQIQATSNPVAPKSSEWLEQAQAIVAYPEDFGMTRRDVRGLARPAEAVARTPKPRCQPARTVRAA